MADDDPPSVREQLARLQTEVEQHNKLLSSISDTLNDKKTGVCARLVRIETTLSNFKWILGIGAPVLFILIELALSELHLLPLP